jgi:hypothetical protein
MSEIGRKGGSVRSDRKARAARRNGHLGGRPRNKLVVPLKPATAQAREPLRSIRRAQLAAKTAPVFRASKSPPPTRVRAARSRSRKQKR